MALRFHPLDYGCRTFEPLRAALPSIQHGVMCKADSPPTSPPVATAMLVAITAVLLATGCSAYNPAPPSYQPQVQRALRGANGPIVASVSIMSRREAQKRFDLKLHKKNIQAVWLRLENRGTNELYFLPAGLDPDYHPPSEVAYMYRKSLRSKRNRRVAENLQQSAMQMKLGPSATNEGFVFTTYDPGAKHVLIDVLGEQEHHQLEFSVFIPGKRFDFDRVDFESIYTNPLPDLTLDELRATLWDLPYQTTGRQGVGNGDPINLVVVSSKVSWSVEQAFVRLNWEPTEVLTFGTAFKLVRSFLFRNQWLTSPVSSLYVFGRRQDAALQKARATIHERNHLRLWLAPFTFEGRRVFVGQISRDIGLRFTFKSPGFTTHKIDPNTDEARDYLAQEMILSGSVHTVSWVGGVGVHTRDAPGRNLTGDPWWTDGHRAVLFLSDEQVPPDEVHLEDWTAPQTPASDD